MKPVQRFPPQDFAGLKTLITTGPTREAIDPVRFITNRSSGKMGLALAKEAYRRGSEVLLISGPVDLKVPRAIQSKGVETASEMFAAVSDELSDQGFMPDVIIMASAVADYRPTAVSEAKIKKSEGTPSIEFEPNTDILQELGKLKGESKRPVLVGFAVETGEESEELLHSAREKRQAKNADMIVANFAHDAFGLDTNRVWIVDRNGKEEEVSTTFKSRIAEKILTGVKKTFMSLVDQLDTFLNKKKSLYPGGIPSRVFEKALQEIQPKAYSLWGDGKKVKLGFISCFQQIKEAYQCETGKLLAASVIKGLKLDLEQIACLAILEGRELSKGEGLDSLKAYQPENLIVFGKNALAALGLSLTELEMEFPSSKIVLTASLFEIAENEDQKRKYWQCLQGLGL